MLTISVSEFRKLKIFRKEQKIDANYFGFRISETENIITRNGKSTRNIWVSEFLTLGAWTCGFRRSVQVDIHIIRAIYTKQNKSRLT